MADPLSEAEPNPLEIEQSPVDWMVRQQQMASQAAIRGLDGSPDEAARAIELGKATGANPALIYGDLENYEQQHKVMLTHSLIMNNQFLRDYANSDPMAAKVSANDWGQLDKISEVAKQLTGEERANLARGRLQPLLNVLSEVEEPKRMTREQILAREAEQAPTGTALLPKQKMVLDMLRDFKDQLGASWDQLRGGVAAATDPNRPIVERALAVPAGAVAGAVQAAGAPVGAVVQFLGDAAERATGGRVSSEEFQAAAGAAGLFAGAGKEGRVGLEKSRAVMDQMAQLARVAKPYIDGREVPPVGAHPIIDEAHREQAKVDAKALDALDKEVRASETGELSPDHLESFLRGPLGDSQIGIDAEAVRRLYGEKQPERGDGLLGDVIGDQLPLAEAHGGDVEVSLAQWLAKVDPEVRKELHDNVRVREGGMTLEEAKEPEAKPVEEVAPAQPTVVPTEPESALQGVRSAAGLAPTPVAPRPEGITPRRGIIPPSAEDTTLTLNDRQVTGTVFPAIDAVRQIRIQDLDPDQRRAAFVIKAILDKVAGDTPVISVTPEELDNHWAAITNRTDRDNIAFYNSKGHYIMIRDDVARGELGPRANLTPETAHAYTASVLMEELLHAATVREMRVDKTLRDTVSQLRREAIEWFEANDPVGRQKHSYALQNNAEFVAWGLNPYSNHLAPEFQQALAKIPVSKALSERIGTKANNLWQVVRDIYRGLVEKWTGKKLTDNMMDALLRLGPEFERVNKEIRAGEEAKARGEVAPTAKPPPELFDRAKALGMSKARAERYRQLIAKQQAEDAEFQLKQGEKVERQRQTKEWKENLARVKSEVQEDLKSRPDIAADSLLREGRMFGKKVRKPYLGKEFLTDDQIKGLPPEYIREGGVNPDDIAGLFGYGTGRELTDGLARLEAERAAGGLTAKAHFSRLVDAETQSQMRRQYGDLETNILDEAKEHVLGATQLDILHEELLALGEKAGGSIEDLSKEKVKAWVKSEFDKSPLSAHDSAKYLAAAGRAGQRAEDALLAQKPTDAFKAKQQQVIAVHLAGMAKKLEKEQASFEKLAKRYSKREIPSVPAEYTNWIHDILMRTGATVRRSVQDLQEAISRETHDNLEDFVNEKNSQSAIWEEDENGPSDFKVMPVAEFLFDPGYRKTVEEMTPGEFRDYVNSIKTLAKNGQDDKKILVAGAKEELADVVQRMNAQLENLFKGKERQYAFGHKDTGIVHAIRTYWASLLQIESIFNRFDRGDPKGIFRKVVTQPIFEGSNSLGAAETRFSKLYRALDFKSKDLKQAVSNPLFGDPLRNGERAPMTRGNLLAVLQNVGNASNLDKLARGYGIKDPNEILQWLFANTTKEDWDRAQKLGDIFAQAFEDSARMYHELSGVAPEKIDLVPIQTPFGEYAGWYHPIIYDPLRPGASKKLMGPSPLEDGSYFKASTPAGYTKKRTGYAAPLQLNFDAVPAKLRAILNDTAMRPAVTEAAKVFYDPSFQRAITTYYGNEIKDLLIPYLKDVAGMKQYKDAAQSTALRVLEYFRQNVTATLIGLNPSTVLKHGPTAAALSIKEVGVVPFLRELKGLLSMNDELGERNWTFAMKGGIVDGDRWGGSEELQRRHRNWQETLTGAQQDVFGENTLRNTIIKLGATPVAISDLLSAVPTWLAAYKDQIRKGEAHGDAVAFADTAVRRAHGSSATAARPRIMRGGPLAQMATPFYTFFNEMFQRQYEMAWRAKDALGQFKEGEYKEGLKEVPNLAKGLWAYIIFPALIEQAVSPLVTGQESTTEKVLTYGARTLASSLPVVRDMVEALLGGRDPTVGLYSTGIKMLADAVRDYSKGEVSFNRAHAGKTIRHTVTAFGAASGLTNAQMGRTGEYVYNYATGQERPRDIGDILKGLWHGTTKEPRR